MRAIRGATTVESDTPEQLKERMGELYDAVIERNSLTEGDIVSIIVTATPDVHSMFPAQALREARGLKDCPLLGMQEIDVEGAPELTLRLLMHVESDVPKSQVHHVFLHRSSVLRPDLSE